MCPEKEAMLIVGDEIEYLERVRLQDREEDARIRQESGKTRKGIKEI